MALSDSLAPTDWATQGDIAALRHDISNLEVRLKADMVELESRMDAKLARLDARLTGQITELDIRLGAKIDMGLANQTTEVTAALNRNLYAMIGTWVASLVAIAGIAISAAT